MAIINRINRLFRADINAILDVIEEPDAVLKQAIREMQETLDRERGELARNQKNIDAFRQNEAHLRDQLAKIQDDLQLCLREGPEDLARKTIGRKLLCEKQLTALQRNISQLERYKEEKTREVEVRQEQLESILEKAEFYVKTDLEDSPFSVADSILSSSEPGFSHGATHVTEEEIEMEWIRIHEKGGKS
jgi:phage shock protein A